MYGRSPISGGPPGRRNPPRSFSPGFTRGYFRISLRKIWCIDLGVDGEVFEWGIFGGLFFEVSDVGEDVFFAFGGGEGGVVDGGFHDGYGFGCEGGIGVEG